MRPGSTPSLVNPVTLFQQATCTNLQLSSGTHRHSIKGSLSKDGKVCWMYSGSILEVVATDTQNRLAAWNFGVMLRDSEVVIQSVAEFWAGDSLRLLVGLKNSSIAGLVCVLNVNLSRVVKAIEIPFKVTSIECITSLLGNDFPVWAFSEHLSCFYGIVAVGTEGGHVYLIDMCLDTHDQSDEMFPNTLHYISPDTEDVVQTRHEALSQRQVLCMELGMDSFSLGSFNYHSNDEAIMKQFKTDEICVTCLKYMSRNGLLAVGYNFGCFQLWRLSAPVLEYSSRLDDSGNVPITHIAYQEPENDPKNFSYLWVSRGPLMYSSQESYLANITLYQLSFNKRMWYSNKECFYEEMSTIGIRLEHDLSSDTLNSVSSKMSSSNVISCYTLEDPYFFLPVRSIDDSHEETSCNPDLSLCVFVWRADNGSKSGTTSYHLAIFDMNRWYHAQMPSNIRTLGNSGICPYMAFCSLDEVIDTTIPDELLCAYINPSTVRKFISDPSLIQEQFFYPSSLQFDVLCLMESGLVNARFLGMQRQVLSTIQKLGPSSLIDPNELYRMCLFVGLVHRTHDSASTHSFSMTNYNREAILSLCLEHHLINVITKSVEQWADGEYLPQGCTLKFLLDWTWNKVVQIKQCVDNTCKPFYDWSGLPVDEQCVQVLHHCLQKLYYLTHILQRFIHTSAPITENGIEELSQKFDAVQLLSHHLKAVIWFVESGLLPENDELASYIPGLYRYPRTSLIEVFMKRREELQQLHSDVKASELLMIDGLIENTSLAVRDLWQQDGGDGQYPPPSINALINFYLLDGVPLLIKHCVISYFLLDLASLEDDSNVKLSEKVATFADVFSVPSDTMNLITGFWLLDHKDFEVAFSFLVNSPVFGPWQHKQVIKALLYQNEGKLALRYLAVKQPPLSSPEEVKLKLTTFLVNGMTAQAVEFQRTCCDQNNAQDLISHIFLGCQQTKTMNQLLKLPLTELEEKWLENYLLSSMESHSEELLVMYYLQRARFVDAIRLNERLKTKAFGMMTAKDRERASTRNAIVNGCAKLLPEVQQQLIFEPAVLPQKMKRDIAVPRPKPLSTMVTKSNPSKLISQSTFVLAVMEKMQEVAQVEDYTNNRSFDELRQRQIEPFISTPITPKKKTPLSDLSKVIYERNLVDEQKAPGLRLSPSSPPTMAANFFSYGTASNKRPSKYVSAEASSLLQTPIIQRKSTPRTHITSPRPTPQSILKVRQISNKSPNLHGTSPLSIGEKDVPEARPALRLSKLNLTLNDSTGSPFGASAKKTKLLRFAEPTLNSSPVSVDDSPTPSSSNAFPGVTARVGLTERKSLSEMIQAERYPPSESVLHDDTFEMDTEMMEEDDEEDQEEVVVETKEEGTYMVTDTKDEDISDEINNSIETEADQEEEVEVEDEEEDEDEEEAMEVEDDVLLVTHADPLVQELVDPVEFQLPPVSEEDLAFVKNTITLTEEEEEEPELMVCKDEPAVIIPDYLTPTPIDLTEDDDEEEEEEEEEEEFKPFKSADIIELAPLGQKSNVSQQVEEYHSSIDAGRLVYEEQQQVESEPLYEQYMEEEEDIPRDEAVIATEMLERERDDVQIITEAVLPVVQPISQEFNEAEKDLDIVEIGEEEEEEEEEGQQVVEVEDEEELEELQLVEVEEEDSEEEQLVEVEDSEEEEDQQSSSEEEVDEEDKEQDIEVEEVVEEEEKEQDIEVEEVVEEEEKEQDIEVEEVVEEEEKEQDIEVEEVVEEEKEQDVEVVEKEQDVEVVEKEQDVEVVEKEQDIEVEEEEKEQDIEVEEEEEEKEQDIEEEEEEDDEKQDIETEEEEEEEEEEDIEVEEEEQKEQDIEVEEEKEQDIDVEEEKDKEQDIEVEEEEKDQQPTVKEEEGHKEQAIEVEEKMEDKEQAIEVEEKMEDKEQAIEVEEEEEEEEGHKEQAVEEKSLEEEDKKIEGEEENRIEMVKEEKLIEPEKVPEADRVPISESLMDNDLIPEMSELPAPPSPSQSATTKTSSQSGSSPSSTSSSPPVYTRRTLRSKVKAESKDANRSEAALVPTMTQPVSEEMTMSVDIAPETPLESGADEVFSETISTRSSRRGPSRSSESRSIRKKASQKSLKSKLESVKKAFLEEIGNISEDSSSEKNLQMEEETMTEAKVSVKSESVSSEISEQDEKEGKEDEEVYSQVKTHSTRSSRSGTPTRRSSRLKTETPSRGTTPTRTTPTREVGPSRGATPTREVGPSRGATPTREVGPSRGATPTREVGPSRGATPTREVGPSRGATPTRDVGPSRGATPTREVGRTRGATPTREVDPSGETISIREAGPSRGTTPTRKVVSSRGTTPVREVGSSRRTRGTTPPREIVSTRATTPTPEVNLSPTVQLRVRPVRASRQTRGGQSTKEPDDDEPLSKHLVNIKIKTKDEIKVEMEETMPESEPEVRVTRRATRKTAPLKSESQLITDSESVLETPSNQQKPFVFCPPVIRKKTQKRESSKKNPKTEESSIIFSTRSQRSALKKDPFIQEDEEKEEMAVDIPMEEPPFVSATTSFLKTPVKARSTRKKVYLVKTTDSPIVNLLTPSRHKTESEEKETTRPAQSRILRKPAHSMVLRTKTAVKKRKL